MINLIKTNDGLIGMQPKDGNVIWADDQDHLSTLVFHHYAYNPGYTREDAATEVAYAMDAMAQMNHTRAEFGVLGSFIYSMAEEQEQSF